MPPKKVEKQGAGKKPSASKTVEDRTFGMKNKKGAQTQKQIAQMHTSAKAGGTPEEKKKAADKAQKEREKFASEAAKKEAAELFKPLQVQKVAFGVDPKTVLCQFYKKGHCEKGKKCKFSHDLNVERKTTKKDLYQDTREDEEETKKKETNEDWDEEKLRSVVLSKKGNQKTSTDKVCKFFIEAVEEGKYGWFWTCPNGGDKCMYQHKLPPGFVANSQILSVANITVDSYSKQRNREPQKRRSWINHPSRHSQSRISSSLNGTSLPEHSHPLHLSPSQNGSRSEWTRRLLRIKLAWPRKPPVVLCSRRAIGMPVVTRTKEMTMRKTRHGIWRSSEGRPKRYERRKKPKG